ncbi:ketol-acid reductoisomerase [Marinicauda salina]|uniref:Ketol-acid reductoisomerase n=1 Tax=Marinicauda salina TaxID=2135793 RepID=A0A2U2BSQ1_9PROT|nr:ketol-acid reductoisomerase [Marinicauda salina]PWE17053.1 ketol-acid reductoisomerase [Marinicauda salina]
MTDALYEAEIDLAPVRSRTIAIVGYGNHGRAHALNLRDQGAEQILIGLREGSASKAKAEADGFETVSIADAARRADAIALLAADEAHGEIWREHVAEHRKPGQALIVCHGFSIEYGLIEPPADCDVLLCAAKGPGGAVRTSFEKGGGLIGFWAVAQDASGEAEALAKAYLAGIGCGRAGIFPTSFGEEALSDILGEQAVLVGGMCALARTGYEALVEAGISPRMAYIDTVHELKYIADLIHERGIAGMYAAISDTAEFGSHEVEGPIAEAVRPVFDRIVDDVTAGDFAARWVADYEAGRAWLKQARARAAAHSLEDVGRELRGLLGGRGED